jgi:hypothetical protein
MKKNKNDDEIQILEKPEHEKDDEEDPKTRRCSNFTVSSLAF